ncbi:MAG: hypothetical protein KGI08_04300 [Thaumarchaeota archaeon]|nr:hypothetical protein [Nitrososphaerota archaeon]
MENRGFVRYLYTGKIDATDGRYPLEKVRQRVQAIHGIHGNGTGDIDMIGTRCPHCGCMNSFDDNDIQLQFLCMDCGGDLIVNE